MKKILLVVLILFCMTSSLVACGSKNPEPQGDPFLLNAAKNSDQVKQAEAAVKDAAEKTKANTDEALKQIGQENK